MKKNLTAAEMSAIREQKNLRFAAAAMAMSGLLSDQTLVASPEEIIQQAVTYADLLITKLNETHAETTN